MATYVFKLKKGELELELQSDDAHFIEAQMDQWREQLLEQMQASLHVVGKEASARSRASMTA